MTYPCDATEDWLKPLQPWPFVDEDGDDVVSVAELLDYYPTLNPRVVLTLPVSANMPPQLRAEILAYPDDEDGLGPFAAAARPDAPPWPQGYAHVTKLNE